MHIVRSFGTLVVALALAGCGDREPTLAPQDGGEPLFRGNHGSRKVVAAISGSAHHTRTVGEVTALTLFRFHAKSRADGTTKGRYFYNFQAAGFSVEGPVTCISLAGNQAWIGGTVARIDSPDPADQELVGVDMWWRMIDNGHGRHAPPDSTTGVGFAFPGSTITAESWCQDQPAVLILREVEEGNLKIKGD
ncbi:MAG: hypothetical protein ACREMX_08820 [Gemmatimonadales bacterium]